MRKINCISVCRAAFLGAILLGCLAGFAEGRKPNILLVLTDDQGWSDAGFAGVKPVLTPNLDRLASEGVRADFYVSWPACTPSRASILTGRYPQRNGLYDMVRNDLINYGHRYMPEEYALSPEMTLGLDPREKTIGDILKAVGYRTGVVGKWDMGQARRYLPLQRGFDFFYGFGNNGIDYYTHERYGVPSMFRGNERTQADRGTYATDLFKREAIEFVRASSDTPWFLYLCFNAPHNASSFAEPENSQPTGNKRASFQGVQVPEKYSDFYRDKVKDVRLARFYGALTCMDEALGEVLKAVRLQDGGTNTLVMFLSDNGGGGNGGNAPLRGGKATMYEGGLRVPFVAWWPGKLPRGANTTEFLTSLELLPTIAAAAGAPLDPAIKLDGFDMMSVLRGESSSSRTEMFWQRRNDCAARIGNWKWISTPAGTALYDLKADSAESRNLAEIEVNTCRLMENRFEGWQAAMRQADPRGPFRNY